LLKFGYTSVFLSFGGYGGIRAGDGNGNTFKAELILLEKILIISF
tara:strand:+ start:1668 stop:1802 length:135 start_codon:yes stop_codon:yes gene_type:complete